MELATQGRLLMKLLVLVFFVLSGCATVYAECADIEGEAFETCQDLYREYDRMEYIETQFKPWLAQCQSIGTPVYKGYISRSLERALNTGDYTGVRKVDLTGFFCLI